VLASAGWASETCRYTGATSYDGQIRLETIAATANGETTVDVRTWVSAKSFGFVGWRYWLEEISVWRDGEVRSIAVNNRYAFAGRVIRQSWDVFDAGPDGLAARRLEGKTAAEFSERHPGFASHWDPDAFGMPWVADYANGGADRRSDLDLAKSAMPPGFGPPLALAFYWSRWVGPDGQKAAVFLPGFKRDSRADISVVSVGVEGDGTRHFRSALRHPQLSQTEASSGDAWIAADHRLTRVTFDAHGADGSAHGDVHLDSCLGDAAAR